MRRTRFETFLVTALGWAAALIMFFPIAWMFLTSFKTEVEAVRTPPSLFFDATLQNYATVQARADYLNFAMNSIAISVGSTIAALALAISGGLRHGVLPDERAPAARLLWMLSTKMLPPVGVLGADLPDRDKYWAPRHL